MSQLTLQERQRIREHLGKHRPPVSGAEATDPQAAVRTAAEAQTVSNRYIVVRVAMGAFALAALVAILLLATGFELGSLTFAGFAAY